MKNISKELAAFWLGTVPGIGPVKAERLVKAAGGPVSLYGMEREELKELAVIGEKDIDALLDSKRRKSLPFRYKALAEKGIRYVSRYGEGYPKKLAPLPCPPLQLYIKGELPDESQLSIAIVGARECTCYGRDMARMFAFRLARAGVQIISGMARGVDGWAHQGALEGGGRTFAVLGCGVDICYPAVHSALYRSIIKRGGVISEYKPQTQAKAPFFPQRNRIISGLSDGILLVEAGKRSGSLITVEAALEQGRDVFVVPGRIGDELSEGCNRLIMQGAVPVLSPEDILAYYSIETKQITASKEYISSENKKTTSREVSSFEDSSLEDSSKEVSSLEERVYGELQGKQLHMDVLCGKLGAAATDVMKTLLELQKEGKVRELSRGYYGVV